MAKGGIPADALAGIRAVFFEECEEHLAELERGLEALARGDHDPELVDTVFRAAHSIKGGASIFEMTAVVRVAHLMESVLAEARKDPLWLTAAAAKALLRAVDGLTDLIRAAREGEDPDPALAEMLQMQVAALLTQCPTDLIEDAETALGFTPQKVDLAALNLAGAEDASWRIRLRPHRRLYANANEPLALLAELERLGGLSVACETEDVPTLDALDPDESYLAWSIVLETDAGEAAIREVFEFVEGDCELEI
ncbi:MAG TPA: Hpt domain-containing protein, partial [Kofleriaceae bacterium]|nr:Hpt domain-containing protein [Kofleriaceae bacterium]